MRRSVPLLLVVVVPLVFCRSTRADFIYSFTTTTPAPDGGGSLSATIVAGDAAVSTGALKSSNIASLTMSLTGTSTATFPFYDATSNDKTDLVGQFLVDHVTGGFSPLTPDLRHSFNTGQANQEMISIIPTLNPLHIAAYFVGLQAGARGGDGSWSVTHTPSVVPAPSASVLAGLGGGILLAVGMRRRHRRPEAAQALS